VFHINLARCGIQGRHFAAGRLYLRDINASTENTCAGSGEVLDFSWGTRGRNIRELRNILERAAICAEKDLITRAWPAREFGKTGRKAPGDLSAIKFPVGTTVDAMDACLSCKRWGNRKQQDAGRGLLGISLKHFIIS